MNMLVRIDAAPIWVLLGAKHGDNRQLLAIAEALQRPYRVIPLRFNGGAALPPALLGSSRVSLRDPSELRPPWPKAVLAAGRRSVPVARWIRAQSGGRTKLIHVNRPWAPADWFDLIVTTPQYALAERANVQRNLLPFVSPPPPSPLPAIFAALAARLPRPWTVALIGGSSRPYVLDAAGGAALGRRIEAQLRGDGGSVWVLGSPRTPARALDALDATLDLPHALVRWGAAGNPYPALLHLADRFLVTIDSASMTAEALASGRPVTPLPLPFAPDWRWRLAALWRQASAPWSSTRRAYAALVDLGLVSSVRDMGAAVRRLADAGVFGRSARAQALIARERERTVARIAGVIDAA